MNEKNLDYLQGQVKYLGFGETLNGPLKDAVRAGHEKFSLEFTMSQPDGKAVYSLNFSKSKTTDMYFFNSFDLELKKSENQTLKHQFQVNGVKGVTAKEALNFLEGRSVRAEIDFRDKGKQDVFIALDQKEMPREATPETKLPVRYFNANYGIDTAKIVDGSPMKLANEKYREDAIKALEKGNFVKAVFSVDGKEINGLVTLNAQYRSLDYHSENGMKMDYRLIDKDFAVDAPKRQEQSREPEPVRVKR